MPIFVSAPWRAQYFESVNCPPGVNIPTDDPECWEWNPAFRWVYDKLKVARSQGIASGTHEVLPASFPVFSKPRINLKGMGLDSAVIRGADEFRQLCKPGHMWMTHFEGEHISTDCAVVNGQMQWLRNTLGVPGPAGTFVHWTLETQQRCDLEQMLERWIADHMIGYTGMMNFETIGGRIIEAHLRFSDQWVDLYGNGWLEALTNLYSQGNWRFREPLRKEGYSIPLFARHGSVPPHPPVGMQMRVRQLPGVSSLQITYFEHKPGDAHPMPPGGFRLAIINCHDLAAGRAAIELLATGFPGCTFI